MGATVDLEALAPLAAMDPETVQRIFTKQKLLGNAGGARSQAVFAAMDYDEIRADRDEARALEGETAGSVWRWRTHTAAANRERELSARLSLAESVPDVLAAFQGRGGGWDAALSARWEQMEAERLAALRGSDAPDAETLAGAPERAEGLAAPKADALSAQGIGYTGNPMGRTEELLREIRDDARANARHAAPEPLLG